ncbi:MAG: AmmeMemoRadiSam system radical SAM enzyme [Bacteroidales bacterium]|nr:AmmeMemoRadiSam system radical SAM enzyme [Bacteroidales bacterium]
MVEPAKYYENSGPGKIRCLLCPHFCTIKKDDYGKCRVRKNEKDVLVTDVYGQAKGLSFDPIEKKPLYHFFPGTQILSLGTPGCNMQCFFCQNWNMSQSGIDKSGNKQVLPAEILTISKSEPKNLGIAFTYSEPTIFYEYMYDTAILFKENGLKTCMISNGFINEKPLLDLIPLIDAFNIDLKAFTNSFYKKYTKSSLKPVLNSLEIIRTKKRHLELSFLVIPGLNDNMDSFKEMLCWISDKSGKETVLHISRYFPKYKSNIPATSNQKLEELFDIAKEKLDYVYIGNYSGEKGQNTICSNCNSIQISRNYYNTMVYLSVDGKCSKCGYKIMNMM